MIHRIPRWPSIVGAIVCSAVVMFTLFRDVRSITDIGASQAYIIVALTLAMISGFYCANTSSWTAKTLWAFVFFVATVTSVGLGGGRNNAMLEEKVAITSMATTALADHRARKAELDATRKELKSKLPALETSLRDATAHQKKECRTRDETRCDGATTAMTSAQKAFDDAQKRYSDAEERYTQQADRVIDAKPPPRANPELNSMTQVLALFTSTHETAEHLFRTIWPFFLATLGELGLIMCAHEAMASRPPNPIVIPAATIKERRADPGANVTTTTIAHELGIQPKLLRKYFKRLAIERPTDGWKFTRHEADAIKQRIAIMRPEHRASVH